MNMWNLGQFHEKIDILSITASLKFESKNSFARVTHIIVIICSTAPFVST